MVSLRSHGWSRDMEHDYAENLIKKYNIDNFHDRFTFYYPGFNISHTELNVFLGVEQLKRLDDTVQKRFDNYKLYKDYKRKN